MTPREKKLFDIQYKAELEVAQMIDTSPETKEEYATREANEWILRMRKLLDREENEVVVDVATGRKLGKRKDVEGQFA